MSEGETEPYGLDPLDLDPQHMHRRIEDLVERVKLLEAMRGTMNQMDDVIRRMANYIERVEGQSEGRKIIGYLPPPDPRVKTPGGRWLNRKLAHERGYAKVLEELWERLDREEEETNSLITPTTPDDDDEQDRAAEAAMARREKAKANVRAIATKRTGKNKRRPLVKSTGITPGNPHTGSHRERNRNRSGKKR